MKSPARLFISNPPSSSSQSVQQSAVMATRTANEAATYFQAFHYWAQQVSHNAIRHVYGKAILTVWLSDARYGWSTHLLPRRSLHSPTSSQLGPDYVQLRDLRSLDLPIKASTIVRMMRTKANCPCDRHIRTTLKFATSTDDRPDNSKVQRAWATADDLIVPFCTRRLHHRLLVITARHPLLV